TFTSVGGFGEGTNVEYYRYVWDRHATHSWNGVEEVWNTNDLTVTSTDGDNWYLHVKGYNGDNIANGTLDLGPFYYDGIAPYPVAVFNGLTDDNNNNSVILTWVDDSQEANFEYYEIFAATFGNYPTYAGGSEKTAPADHASAVSSADWSFIGTTTDLTYTHTPETRDYYYYVVFAKDLAGNYSVVSDRAECLSYWLGDVNATPDGLVNSDDISLLGAAWGGAITTYPNINVGPTVDYARDSRPTPDEAIDFEDLMIFSMNYGNTSYSKGTTLPESVDPVYLSMHREIAEGCLQVSIHLIGNESLVHGLNIKLTLGDGLNVKTVNKGDVWTDMDFFMYTSENQVLEITGATLGTGTSIAGDGSIANLVFEMNGDNTTTEYLEVVARDNENRNIAIILNPITGTGSIDQANALGLTAAPNPFTAYTQIAFNNENRQRVTLAVYNLNGQVITTLCKDMLDKGNHTFYWNGTDFKGSRLPNGIYLIRLTAGTQSAFTKAILTD
ncbi:MAG: T9SS type A sorting domain-containing protein, partial [Bacteroidia bacterium]|nr:T9SS type A sorting domain-containing protein [Bacteroidia bacterium]